MQKIKDYLNSISMVSKKGLLTMLIIAFMQVSFGQNYKIGKVSKEELQEKAYPSDSSADAAYLYKNRRTYFEYVQGKGFVLITEVHERIKIYNKDGYGWATKTIQYYSPEKGEIEKISIEDAKTYALIGGKIKINKLEKKNIFKNEVNKYTSEKKFTMPNINDGCIVEWLYIIRSPYKSIDNVVMQYKIPILNFKSSIEIPEYYKYNVKQIGYIPINMTSEVKNANIKLTNVSETGISLYKRQTAEVSYSNINYKTNITRILKNNIPALIEEPYVNEINNYRSAIDYELASIKWPNETHQNFSQSWEDVAETIMKNTEFGVELEKTGHLRDDIAQLNTNLTTLPEKLFGALEYVKGKIKWNDYYGKYTENGLRKAYKEGIGNIADINLTLVAVLRELDITANPVLVSTRSHGFPTFPTLSGFIM